MADNYARGGQTFRSKDKSNVHYPVALVGAHVRTYTGTQVLTLSGSSQTLTVPSNTEFADIYCQGAASTDFARFWHSGSVPTATVGVKMKDDSIVQSADPSTFRAINGTGSSCTLYIEYYRYV